MTFEESIQMQANMQKIFEPYQGLVAGIQRMVEPLQSIIAFIREKTGI